MNPELVRAYLAKACGCMDPNGQWQKRYGAKMKMCGNCAHLFNLFTRDDLTEAFQHVRRLKSLGFLASSYITQAPHTTIKDALGEFYRTEAYPPREILRSGIEQPLTCNTAAQHQPAVTNSPANPVPPAAESATSTAAAHTGGVGNADSREHGPSNSRPPQEQGLPRKSRASGPGHFAA